MERQARLLREQKSREKKAKKSKKDSKKDKKKKGKKGNKRSDNESKIESEQKPSEEEKEEPLPEIVVSQSEIHINYFDLYPAEMVIWKDFEPKYIEANFIVEVSYLGKNM